MSTPLFQILICTLKEREEKFNKLNEFLIKQIEENGLENEVGILSFSDNRNYTVGMKRNLLVKNSTAKYVGAIDDDDWVSATYVKDIHEALIENPDVDCIGLKGLMTSNVNYFNNRIFLHSIQFTEYLERNDGVYLRPPNHLNPIKREFVVKFPFPIINRGEDTDFAMRLCKSELLQNEAFINDILYYYKFNTNVSATLKR